MAGTATKKRLARQKRDRKIAMLKNYAETFVSERLGDVDGLESLLEGTDDGWEHVRERIIKLGAENGHWAGYPLPSHHAKLVTKPQGEIYRNLNGFTFDDAAEVFDDPSLKGCEIVNTWVDKKSTLRVFIVRHPDGKISHAFMLGDNATRRHKFALDTLGASQAWSIRAEFTALARLKTLITPVAFRYYVLTGSFIETSPRSNVIYMFRKCRPTVAIGRVDNDNTKILAALCLHPIGYYEHTFAGSMVPTDDVIAHLLMMRGDEHKFWAHANQHPPEAAEAGI